MTLPVPGQPGETPEQRQARFAAADAMQARIDAERRAQLEAQANPVSRRLPEGVGIPMPVARPPVGIPVPITQPPSGGLTQAAPFDVAAAYRQHSQKLADAIKAGQITVERARQLQAPLFAATKLGSTPEGQAAMNAAAAQAQGGMPMSGYDAGAQYRNFGQELMGMIKSGALTVEQANALKAPVFNAVKLGNSNAGYQQMQAALNAARQQMGGQNMGITVKPVQPQEIVVTGQRMPEPPPPPPPMPQPPMPQPPEREVIGQRSPIPGVHGGDTRIFAPTTPPPMALPGGTGYDEQGNMIRSNPDYLSGIGSLLANFGKSMGNAPMQPDFIGKHFTGSAPPPGKKYIETSEGLVPVPINDVPVKPAMGPGLGGSLGMQGVGMAPQMPPQAAVAQPASAPQGMAMGGLLRKYYGGGMC